MDRLREGASRACEAALWLRAGEHCEFSMSDVTILLARLAVGEPFAFVHFNDGELEAAEKLVGATPLGNQRYSPTLRQSVRAALNSSHPRLFTGLPCPNEFPEHHALAKQLERNDPARQTGATIFINGNWREAFRLLPRLVRVGLEARRARLHLVVGAMANVSKFSTLTKLVPSSITRTPARNSFEAHDSILPAVELFAAGDVVIVCTGMLGRILVSQWVGLRPNTTFLELGSFFNPVLGGSMKMPYQRRVWDPGCANRTDRRAGGGLLRGCLEWAAGGLSRIG